MNNLNLKNCNFESEYRGEEKKKKNSILNYTKKIQLSL